MAKKSKQSKTLPIYVLNGPNLNLLGHREPEIYGRTTLADIEQAVQPRGRRRTGSPIVFRQSNREGELVDWIQEARTKGCGVILNAGALTPHLDRDPGRLPERSTHPMIEVHLSNPYAREPFRHRSYVSRRPPPA